MAQLTNTFETYDAVGNREDLQNIIYNIQSVQVMLRRLNTNGKLILLQPLQPTLKRRVMIHLQQQCQLQLVFSTIHRFHTNL